MNVLRNALLGALGATLLAGCGFHPVGSRALSPSLKSVHVELIDQYRVSAPPVEESLKALIIRSGGVVKSTAEEAAAVLRLTDLREAQEVLSIGTDGRAIEYRLLTRVTFEMRRVVDGKSELLIAPETQTVSRDYSFSAQQILAKEAEEARLRRYIQDELAERVLLRIEARLAALDPGLAPPAEAGKPAADAAQPPELKSGIVPADVVGALPPG